MKGLVSSSTWHTSAVCYSVFGSWVSCLCFTPLVSLNGSSISFILMWHHAVTSVCRIYCHHVLSASTLLWKSPHFPEPPLPTSPRSFPALHWNGSAKPWYRLRRLQRALCLSAAGVQHVRLLSSSLGVQLLTQASQLLRPRLKLLELVSSRCWRLEV